MNGNNRLLAAAVLPFLISPVWGQTTTGGAAGAQAAPRPTTGAQTTPAPAAGVQTAPSTVATPGVGAINSNPFFANPGMRTQLGLNDQSFNALNMAHNQAFTQFNNAMSQFDKNMTAAQRVQRMQDLQNAFNQQMANSAQDAITNPAGVQRFNQLSLQFQGLGAFSNPQVQQQLNLSTQQRQQLQQFGQQLDQAALNLQRNPQLNDQARNQQFRLLQLKALQDVNSVLTNQQQQQWQQMTGQPFSFQLTDFFPPTTTTNPLGAQK